MAYRLMVRSLHLLCLTLIWTVLLTSVAQANVFTSIAKIASKVDVPASALRKVPDDSLRQLNLIAQDGASPTLLTARLDIDGVWVLRNSDGDVVSGAGQLDNTALVIDKIHLPRDLSKLESLPRGKAVLIHTNQAVFRLGNKDGWLLSSGGAGINVNSYGELQKAISHFQRPWANGPVRILGLKDKPANSLSLRRGVDSKTLVDTPEQLRQQTIVIAGKITGDEIKTAAGSFSISMLSRKAEQFDISLLMIDGPNVAKPAALLKQLDANMVEGVPQNTGQFLARLHDPQASVLYQIDPSGKQQVLISRVERAPKIEGSGNAIADVLLTRALFAGAKVALLRPNEARLRELENRLISWLPAWIPIYLLLSFILGLVTIKTGFKFFGRIWPWPNRQSVLRRYAERSVWVSLVLVFVLPVFGAWIALYRIVRVLISIIAWILNLIIGLFILLLLPFFKLCKHLRAL